MQMCPNTMLDPPGPLKKYAPGFPHLAVSIEFSLPVTIVIIPDVLVTNLITRLY